MIIQDLIQGSQAWLDFRKERIGASDIPVIMKTSPYQTITELFLEKIGEIQPKPSNFAMERGHKFEPIVRDMWRKMSGDDYQPIVVQHEVYDWAIASLDGHHIGPKDNAIIEIKYNGKENHEHAKQGQVPLHHMQQMQWQFFVTGANVGFYLSYDGNTLETVEVKPDLEIIDKIVTKAQWFYNCIITRTPPEEPIAEDLIALMEDYAKLSEQAVLIQESLDVIKDQIKAITPLEKTITWKNVTGAWRFRQGNVDYSKVKELHGVNLDQYRKKGISYFELKARI